MAELADAADSKSADGDIVRVRPPLRVLFLSSGALHFGNGFRIVSFADFAFQRRAAGFFIFSVRLAGGVPDISRTVLFREI